MSFTLKLEMLRCNIFLLILGLASICMVWQPASGIDDAALAERFARGAERGDPIAQNNLGALYLKGRGVEQNYATAIGWFQKAAESGLAGAFFNLGMVHLRGYGVDPDVAAANERLTTSAHLGDRDAQFFLGLHYYQGTGFEKDLENAKLWFRRAADQGAPAAMYNLGILYLDPDPAISDESQALAWLDKASQENYPGTELVIAKVHLSHTEDQARVALGAEQYKNLAASNNLDAQIQLGMMYTFGQGVEQNYDEGRFWLERAASQGASQAQLNLGNLFAEGLGVEKHLPRALAWYSIGAENNDPAATQNAILLSEQLKKDERQEAEAIRQELEAKFGGGLYNKFE